MNKEKLNEKIARYFNIPLLPYTDSMDACIKEIFPRIWSVDVIGNVKEGYDVAISLGFGKGFYPGEDKNLATAFCLAVEKLIGSMVIKEGEIE